MGLPAQIASLQVSVRPRGEPPNGTPAHPEAGDGSRGSGGCRKVRWTSTGQGKRGGARVIYFNASTETIWLLIVYKKAQFDNLPTSFLAQLKQGVEDAL